MLRGLLHFVRNDKQGITIHHSRFSLFPLRGEGVQATSNEQLATIFDSCTVFDYNQERVLRKIRRQLK